MAKKQGLFGTDVNLDETSQTNISEISFPSHVSGLESFSEFDKTFSEFQEDHRYEKDASVGANSAAGGASKEPNASQEMSFLKLNLPSTFDSISPNSVNSDILQLSSNDLFDLHTPSTGREQIVTKFLTQDRNSKPASASLIKRDFVEDIGLTEESSPTLSGQARVEDEKPRLFEERQILSSRVGQKNMDQGDFSIGIGINQRPGLDGSSSDSDDGATLNFARSRIGTINQQQLAAFLDEREQDNDLSMLEERQLAEGDDVFSRDVPGDGGGGGDGSSGHSDSDIDGDGGVAIRVRSRGTQRNRARATAAIQPFSQQNENLPERERPVGDSVPASNRQWRNQTPTAPPDNADDNQLLATVAPRGEFAPTPMDFDSSQDSRLSARFFIASSTPGALLRQNSTPQSNWMEENTTTFRFSESAPATPCIGDETPDVPSFNSDMPVFLSPSVSRDVVGDDNEGDETITGATPSMSTDMPQLPPKVEKTDMSPDSTLGISASNDIGDSAENGRSQSMNPFRSDVSINPFKSFAYDKNPFDTLDMAEDNNDAFSGFGEQNDSEIGESGFKLNSQDAEALFDEDEKSFQHSNTISKLANISNESEWSMEDVTDKGEVRLSKYFNAMSEELGTFSLDRPDRPRPNFDDYKVVKTPPALDRPAVLYRGLPSDSTLTAQSFSYDAKPQSNLNAQQDAGGKLDTAVSNFGSTFALSRPTLDRELAELGQPPTDAERNEDRGIGDISSGQKDSGSGQKYRGSCQKDSGSGQKDRGSGPGDRSGSQGIKGQGGTINIPKTNDEAENLLHDIGVGRVSLRGISGVNISNLAAKIAVATNSDPKFILRLLISLIEGEKNELAETGQTRNALPSQKDDAIIQPGKESKATYPVNADSGQQKTRVSLSQSSQSVQSSNGLATKPPLARIDYSKSQSAYDQEQSSFKLSDLDDTLTPIKAGSYTAQSREQLSTWAAASFQDATGTSKQEKLLDLSDAETAEPPAVVGSRDTHPRSLQASKDTSKQLGKTVDKSQLANARPISSVVPLVATRENRALYRDSGVQCYSKQQQERIQLVERGASFERSVATTNSRNVSTADAAVQWEGPLEFQTDADVSEFLRRVVKNTTDVSSCVQSSLRSTAARQLSSTTIEAGESDEQLAKGLPLSPVISETDPLFLGQEDENWKPVRASKKALTSTQIGSRNVLGQIPKPVVSSSVAKSLKMSGEQIHDILPRISDIRVRESNATFYPLMATNQTVLGRPSVDPKMLTQGQKDSLQKQYSHQPLPLQTVSKSDSKEVRAGPTRVSEEFRSKKLSLPTIQIIVPTELCFSGVQCVGVAINQCLPIHNPSSRWIQCLIEIMFYSVNGSQADANTSCVFSMQPKVFIAPHTTEDVKITFLADYAGVYMSKLNLIASPVVTDDSVLSEDEMFPNEVHMEGIAELPNIEIFQGKGDFIDYGEMPSGISRARSIKLLNKGRADVPLKLVLSGNSNRFRCFEFVDSDMTPIGSMTANNSPETEELTAPILNVLLPGGKQMGKTFEPEVIWIQFKAPEFHDRGLPSKLGPPNEFSSRVDIEIDSKGSGIIVGSMLLKALVGIARLHAPRSLQAISLSAPEGQRVSRGIPFRNAGNISLEIRLQVSAFTDLFSVVPDQVVLTPGESTEVFVHFLSVSSITIESFLLVSVHPDGPQYEVVLRGTATPPKPVKEKEEKPDLLCNKPVLCWTGIPIGRSVQQRAYLRNNSLNQDLQMTISVEGNHSDFQVQNTFDFKEKGENMHEVTLKPQSEVPVHVLFVPSTFGMISSALVIRPAASGPKFKIPLYGYGGCSRLQLTNAQKVGDNYWVDAGEVSVGKQNIINLSLQNVGNRAAFVKIVCYADVSKRILYPSSHISIAPNDFVLLEKCTKQLVVVLQPTETVLQGAKEKPCAAASLAIFSGDESIRQLYRKNKIGSNQLAIQKEGPMKNVLFDAHFMDEEKLVNDLSYPNIPNWENFFVSAVSRTVVSLVARPTAVEQQSTSTISTPVGLDPKDLIVNQTPARALPEETSVQGERSSGAHSFDSDLEQRKETWAVSPEHIVLTAPNTISDKSTARIQMINYSDKPLGFEFSWPAQSLIITPSKDNVPPRSQLIVFVSTKPSFLTTGGELPWRGCIYVQCQGAQKCVRVQIREDLALDSSPFTGAAQRLAPLNPSNTPFRPKQPIKLKALVSIEPTSVAFPVTIVNRFQESFVKIESNSPSTLKWVLSSIAPPYFKDISESGDIFRTTYTAFRFSKHSGTLQPKESSTIQVTFQPRDHGEYSQFWDLQVAVEATGETGKTRVELRGKGIFPETNLAKEDEKLVGRAHPILKPATDPEDSSRVESKEPEKDAEGAATSKIEKKNRGIFVKDDVLNFKPTNKGETTEMQFRLCNDTKELQKVRLSGVKPPFSMKLSKLAIKSKSFIRVPVFYTPTEVNTKSDGLLEVTCVSGSARTSFVKLIGTCQSRR